MTIFRVGAVRPAPARALVRAVVLLAAAAPALAAACAKKEADAAPAVQTAPAARQDVVVDVEATGQITPVNAVDVR